MISGMRAVGSRFGPAIVFFGGTAIAAAILFLQAGRAYDGLNHYEAQNAVAVLVYAASAATATGWSAFRGSNPLARFLAGALAGLWGLLSAALFFDLMWFFVGPGVEPMPDLCLGGMDCIGEPFPGAPLTGDGQYLACQAVLSIPFVALLITWLIPASPDRPPEPVSSLP